MTMSNPGRVGATQMAPASQKRFGLLRMQVDSNHMITTRPESGPPRRMQVRVRDKRLFPKAKGVLICLSTMCIGRTWATEEAMAKDHADHATMEREQQVHVFGLWSEDPIGQKEHGCEACEKSKTVPCRDHHGGVLGLLSSGD